MDQNRFVFLKEEPASDDAARTLDETLFHNANGYLGVRGTWEEGVPAGRPTIRGQYLNGFYDFVPMKQAEKLYGFVEEKQTMLNVADTQTVRLTVGGHPLSLFTGTVGRHHRVLDMAQGFTERRLAWTSPAGQGVEVTSRRMASFVHLPLFTLEYTVTAVGGPLTLTLESDHRADVTNFADPLDPRVAAEAFHHLHPRPPLVEGPMSLVTADTARSALAVTSLVHHSLSVPAAETIVVGPASVTRQWAFTLAAGQSVTLTKLTLFADSVRQADPEAAARRALAEALGRPLAGWYQAQKAYLDDFWSQADVQIEGDDDLSRAVTFNLYQLLQSAGKDPHANIAAKGLSGEGYEGHYFWDTEIYLLPFFSLNFPQVAKNLIAYRHGILGAARENARTLGHRKGALFPWRTIMGKECSGYYPSGTAQYHINGDVAYSVIQYWQITKDLDFLAEVGAEILVETARLWVEVGHEHQGRFLIHGVTGPDEYTCLVNNNYYTNALAQKNLRWAVKALDLLRAAGRLEPLVRNLGLDPAEADAWTRAADRMWLPFDEGLGINPQDDSFLTKPLWDFAGTRDDQYPLLLHFHPLNLYRHQVCKQADTVLAHFLMEEAQDLETIRRSFAYYEGVTTHDSSLSTCIFSIVASRLGLEDKAYRYFDETSKLDLLNTHGNTKDGIHAANMGGTYMGIVFGFGGLRITEGGLTLAPALPRAWRGYEFKVHWEASRVRVKVGAEGCVLTLEQGPPVDLKVWNQAVRVEGSLALGRPTHG